ncbi:Myb-like domain-containing protein [Entamoeba marina]
MSKTSIPHLIPAVKMPTDPRHLVHNDDEQSEWTDEEQRILEEKLKTEGNDFSTIFRLVGEFHGKTIQQITTRANWSLLPEKNRISFDEYRKQNEQGKTEIQLTLPSTSKACGVVKKKRPRQRHYSVIEETPSQKQKRHRIITKEALKAPFQYNKTGLSQMAYPVCSSDTFSPVSGGLSPRVSSLSPNPSISMDMSSVITDPGIDLSSLTAVMRENEDILSNLQSVPLDNPTHVELVVKFTSNLSYLVRASQQLTYSLPLPYFYMQLRTLKNIYNLEHWI